MKALLHSFFDLIAPRRCVVCGQRLSLSQPFICARCRLMMPLTGFAADAYENAMARLFWLRVPIERAAALFYYEPGSAVTQIVKRIKYGGDRELGHYAGEMMGRELSAYGFFDGIDGIVAVPLAKKRERQRGFNQSLLLAEGIGCSTGLPVIRNAVVRTEFHKSQTQLSYSERAENVDGVFKLTHPEALHGRHILLVDDVVTTGATCTACGNALVKAGDTKLSILSLAFTRH